MAKLVFYYGCMNAGKSMLLLAKAYNFEERGIPYRIYKSSIDTRDEGVIHSRPIGDKECLTIKPEENFFKKEDWFTNGVKWILVDEAQFLTSEQVDQLASIVDNCDVNVICYGLRTDFQTHLFEGSKRLFEVADTFEEIKSQCSCGNKNIFNARFGKGGDLVTEGNQIEVGAEDKYKSICRRCYHLLKMASGMNKVNLDCIFDQINNRIDSTVHRFFTGIPIFDESEIHKFYNLFGPVEDKPSGDDKETKTE